MVREFSSIQLKRNGILQKTIAFVSLPFRAFHAILPHMSTRGDNLHGLYKLPSLDYLLCLVSEIHRKRTGPTCIRSISLLACFSVRLSLYLSIGTNKTVYISLSFSFYLYQLICLSISFFFLFKCMNIPTI